jgi:hypothetical protein
VGCFVGEFDGNVGTNVVNKSRTNSNHW